MKNSILFLFFLSLFIWNCTNPSPSSSEEGNTEGEKEGMTQFTEDEKFKEAHENPRKINPDLKGKMIKFDTPDGKKGSAYAVISEDAEEYLLVIHEWWGLNEHIMQEADRFAANLGSVNILALDLYDGKVADNRDQASEYMNSVTQERAEAIIKGAINLAGAEAEIATVGWCFGGGWSLKASILAGEQGAGCVMYYGMPVKDAKALAPLEADILGIFAEKDEWITPEVVNNFEALADATKKDLEVHQFNADHAFANPSSPRYNEEAAQKANQLALEFLKEKL